MPDKPVVFISATSDLRSARDLAGKALYSMGYEPVWQDVAATEGGELLEVLRHRVEPCAVVVQLVGQRYGAEPPQPTREFGRVSYTQFEALYAERLGREVIYYFIAPGFPPDPAPPESDELVQLQTQYRERLVADNKLRHEGVATPGDLELSIRRIGDELAKVRTRAERRASRTLWLTGAALAGLATVAALVLGVLHQQGKQSAELKDELAAMRGELLAAIAPKPLAQGHSKPGPLPPELIEKAKILLERGNAEDQALAKIALRQHDAANRIIQELKARPGNPIDEAFRLLTLEGDNWYQAGEYDKAIGPYEKAMALRPTDFEARKNVALAHIFARLGSIADHQRRAIEVADGTLRLVAPGSENWATAQNSLGMALSNMPTGDKAENLRKAIDRYEAALTVYTKIADPSDWAMAQNNLGVAWSDLPTGDKAENVRKAIDRYGAALTVYTRIADPRDWAMAQNNLGNAWKDLPTGDMAENIRKAIACYEAALAVYTKTADPTGWAMTQNNLGNAWKSLPAGDKAENLRKAFDCFEAALTVRTKTADPGDWAMTQNNLGNAWCGLPTGDKAGNLRKAIDCFEAALAVYTKTADPARWACTQNNLGIAWHDLPTGDKAENLRKAIDCYEAALTVCTKTAGPRDWAGTQNNLGLAWHDLPTGDKAENVREAIACSEAALTVYSKTADPADWAMTQNNLGVAWRSLPAGDKAGNLRKAIDCCEAALTVYTKTADPTGWAMTQNNLGSAWALLPTADKAGNLRKAIACYEAALTVYTKTADPADWAGMQHNLGIAWSDLPTGDKAENLRKAIACVKAALLVYTADAFPHEYQACESLVETLRKAYESSAGPKARPFDDIPPAA
jgi:tetratricopeptide (TPR) repeat protein